MFRHNFLLAVRSILKNKVTSSINLLGLTLAFSALLLMLLYIIDETSYDRYNKNGDRIYRVSRESIDIDGLPELHFGNVNFALAVHARDDFAQQIESVVRFSDNSNTLVGYESSGKSFVESRMFFADPDVFNVFSWSLTKGNATTALTDLNTVAISESVAKRYFESEEAMGKILMMENKVPLMITAVFRDIPTNSHFKPDLLVSMATREQLEGREDLMRNQSNNDATYVLLKPEADIHVLEASMPSALDKYYELMADGRKSSQAYRYHFWPLKNLHLFFTLDSSTESNGNFVIVYIFVATAFLILVVACINFINLSTARLSQRAKEVGLKKTLGATHSALFNQFISESFLFALLSIVLAIGAAYFLLPAFNTFIEKSLSLSQLGQPKVMMAMIMLLLAVSLIAGGYPAFLLSAFKASEVMTKGVHASGKKFSVRSILVWMQFLLAFVLIISVGVVKKQLAFVDGFDVGFNRNSLLVLPSSPIIYDDFKSVKAKLEQKAGIELVSLSSRVPSGRLMDAQDAMIEVNGKMQAINLRIADIHVDHDYFNVLGLPIVAGRNFNYDLASDSLGGFILNETAVKSIGWKSNEDAVGKIFHYGSRRKGTIIGVVKDFNFESLHEPIKPIVFVVTRGRARSVILRIDEREKTQVLKYLAEQWTYWRPGFPFSYYSLSDNFEKQYDKEKRVAQGVSFFALFAVIISSLGVFALALFMAEQRTKEIGIRKTLGAGSTQIMVLLASWFFFLMMIAGLVAIPLSYWLATKWLDTFAFAVGIGYSPFVVAFGVVVFCTTVSIVVQLWRSSVRNPVHALRNE